MNIIITWYYIFMVFILFVLFTLYLPRTKEDRFGDFLTCCVLSLGVPWLLPIVIPFTPLYLLYIFISKLGGKSND